MRLRTALCDLLGIEYPVLQSGMGSVAGPDLAAEVSRAGGLGIVGGLNQPPDAIRERIRFIRAHTDRPFGVNLWLHSELRPPVDVTTIPPATIAQVHATLNTFRARLDVPAVTAAPPPAPDLVDAALEVILEERVPVFSAAIGLPSADMVTRCHARGVKVVAMVATVQDARDAAAAGVDAIVAQGGEAGGHRSIAAKPIHPEVAMVGTMALVPQIVDVVRVPVVAAGGLADGRGLVAALALGAQGVLLGTRFVATRESTASEFYKKSLLERDADATMVTDAFTGQWARALRNTFAVEYRAAGAPTLPSLLQAVAAQDVFAAAAKRQDGEYFPMYAGQAVGLVHNVPGAGEVVEAIVREAREVLAALGRLGRGDP
ncbi:MAG: nitronate monooxygenase [Candidatus Rokubacteria bacterium]|nr:nitronate monooxygenase [Candidatus Rokubacteria bacterium]